MIRAARRGCGSALLISLVALPLAAADGAESRVSLQIQLVPQAGVEIGGARVSLRSSSEAETRTVATSAGVAVVDVPAGSSWELTAELSNGWAAPQAVLAATAGNFDVRVPVWPVASLEGTFKLPAGETVFPSELTASLEPTPLYSQGKAIERGSSRCVVEERGHFRCVIPAGTILDLALRAPGYVPQYRWRLEARAGATVDLGSLQMVRGASMSGWLAVEEGIFEASKAHVRLLPMQMTQGDPVTAQQIRNSAEVAEVRKDGFYQIAAVRPGRYVLVADHPGYASAEVSGIDIYPGAESALREPVVLRRPLTLQIAIEPALDWLGKPWQVEVRRGEDLSGQRDRGPVYEGPSPANGHLRIENVAPGNYSFTVSDGLGNRFFSADERAILDASSARLEAHIALVRVEGSLRFGGEPVAGTIIFGTRFGDLRSAMEADTDGHFEGVLPRIGRWRLEVQVAEPPLEVRAATTVAEDGHVAIDLPATHLLGMVVNEADAAVAAANVHVSAGPGVFVQRFTNAEGKFEVRGLPEGEVRASAEAGPPGDRASSELETVVLKSKETTGPVVLKVVRRKKLRGRVASSFGPVPGASVQLRGGKDDPIGSQATTDLEGRFELDASRRLQDGTILVRAAGYGLKFFDVGLDTTFLELSVSDQSGAIELEMETSSSELSPETAARLTGPFLFQDGHILGLGELMGWGLGHGKPLPENLNRLDVPAMAAGEYRFCFGYEDELFFLSPQAWAETKATCDKGYLSPGGTLRLRLDLREKSKDKS